MRLSGARGVNGGNKWKGAIELVNDDIQHVNKTRGFVESKKKVCEEGGGKDWDAKLKRCPRGQTGQRREIKERNPLHHVARATRVVSFWALFISVSIIWEDKRRSHSDLVCTLCVQDPTKIAFKALIFFFFLSSLFKSQNQNPIFTWSWKLAENDSKETWSWPGA